MSHCNDCQRTSSVPPGYQWLHGTIPSNQPMTTRSMGVNTESSPNLLEQATVNQATASAICSKKQYQRSSEQEEEEELIDTIEQLIHEFLSRPSRRQPYKSLWRWTVDCGAIPPHHVELKISQTPVSSFTSSN